MIDELIIRGNNEIIPLTSISTLGCNFFMRSATSRDLDLDFSLVEKLRSATSVSFEKD